MPNLECDHPSLLQLKPAELAEQVPACLGAVNLERWKRR